MVSYFPKNLTNHKINILREQRKCTELSSKSNYMVINILQNLIVTSAQLFMSV